MTEEFCEKTISSLEKVIERTGLLTEASKLELELIKILKDRQDKLEKMLDDGLATLLKRKECLKGGGNG